jgi:hypothetical protein
MQIKFTKPEMEKLLELLNIAEWVLTSEDVDEDERKEPYLKLLQRLYHVAYEGGMTKEIVYDKAANDYYFNEDWEEEVQARDFIEEYEDASFWDELVFRLADRDIDRKMNGKPPKNFEEHVAMFTKIQSKYEEEFEKNNLENLEIVAPKAKPAKAEKNTKASSAKKTAPKKASPAGKTVKASATKKASPKKAPAKKTAKTKKA